MNEEIVIPVITEEMIKKVFNGEPVELLPAPGKGFHYKINENGTILKVPDVGVIYE